LGSRDARQGRPAGARRGSAPWTQCIGTASATVRSGEDGAPTPSLAQCAKSARQRTPSGPRVKTTRTESLPPPDRVQVAAAGVARVGRGEGDRHRDPPARRTAHRQVAPRRLPSGPPRTRPQPRQAQPPAPRPGRSPTRPGAHTDPGVRDRNSPRPGGHRRSGAPADSRPPRPPRGRSRPGSVRPRCRSCRWRSSPAPSPGC
jgi:translation initiation factor IF-2